MRTCSEPHSAPPVCPSRRLTSVHWPLYPTPHGTTHFLGPRPASLPATSLYPGLSHPLGSGVGLWFEITLRGVSKPPPLTPSAVLETPSGSCDLGAVWSHLSLPLSSALGPSGSGTWGMAVELLLDLLGKRRQLWAPWQTLWPMEAPGLGPAFSGSPGFGVTRVVFRAGKSWLLGVGVPAGLALWVGATHFLTSSLPRCTCASRHLCPTTRLTPCVPCCSVPVLPEAHSFTWGLGSCCRSPAELWNGLVLPVWAVSVENLGGGTFLLFLLASGSCL